MNKDSGMTLTSLKVDGGMTSDNLLMQLQADLIGINVGLFLCLFFLLTSRTECYINRKNSPNCSVFLRAKATTAFSAS